MSEHIERLAEKMFSLGLWRTHRHEVLSWSEAQPFLQSQWRNFARWVEREYAQSGLLDRMRSATTEIEKLATALEKQDRQVCELESIRAQLTKQLDGEKRIASMALLQRDEARKETQRRVDSLGVTNGELISEMRECRELNNKLVSRAQMAERDASAATERARNAGIANDQLQRKLNRAEADLFKLKTIDGNYSIGQRCNSDGFVRHRDWQGGLWVDTESRCSGCSRCTPHGGIIAPPVHVNIRNMVAEDVATGAPIGIAVEPARPMPDEPVNLGDPNQSSGRAATRGWFEEVTNSVAAERKGFKEGHAQGLREGEARAAKQPQRVKLDEHDVRVITMAMLRAAQPQLWNSSSAAQEVEEIIHELEMEE